MASNIKKAVNKIGLPRLIILSFFLFLIIVGATTTNLNMQDLFTDVIRRWGMYGILVLAMVPGIQSGIGPNFGVTIGIVGGLLGALISVELRFYKFFVPFENSPVLDAFVGVLVAIVLSLIFSSVFGILYGMLLNKVKGSEMTVSTYVGFSVVAFMNIMWLVLPFKSHTSIWPVGGEGLRNTISLENDFSGVFNKLMGFTIGGIYIPIGLVLMLLLCCLCVWIFTRSRVGIMMSAAGANPSYAKVSGINVDKMRILGTTVSTVLGGIGIITYAQSFGFLQLYNAPQMMGFSSVASVLIGGATIRKANISNVLIGTFLFQGILAVALPVANEILPEGNLSEILRIIIANGIILYALSKSREVAE